jgi:hypothetical protein
MATGLDLVVLGLHALFLGVSFPVVIPPANNISRKAINLGHLACPAEHIGQVIDLRLEDLRVVGRVVVVTGHVQLTVVGGGMFKKSSLTESKSGRNRSGPGLTRSSSSISCHGMEFPVEAIPPSAQMLQLISDGPQGEAGQETYRKCRWVDSPCIQSWSLKTTSRFHAFKQRNSRSPFEVTCTGLVPFKEIGWVAGTRTLMMS